MATPDSKSTIQEKIKIQGELVRKLKKEQKPKEEVKIVVSLIAR